MSDIGPPDTVENFNSLEFLSSLPEFSKLTPTELQTLASASRFASLDPGQYITTEGDEESLYGFIVVSGCLSMIKGSSSGKELIVELLQSGDIFGLLLMLAKGETTAQLSARSLQHSTVLWIPVRDFQALAKTYPSLLKDAVTHLLLCLQSSYRLSRGLAHDRVEVRIASILCSLSIKFGRSLNPSSPPSIRFTRQQLADLTGTTPETAIRVTRSMQRAGLIDIGRPGIIRILKFSALQDMVEG